MLKITFFLNVWMQRKIKPRTTALHFYKLNKVETLMLKRQRIDKVISPSHSLTLNILHHSQHSSADWRCWWRDAGVPKRSELLPTTPTLSQNNLRWQSFRDWKHILQTLLCSTQTSSCSSHNHCKQICCSPVRQQQQQSQNHSLSITI